MIDLIQTLHDKLISEFLCLHSVLVWIVFALFDFIATLFV